MKTMWVQFSILIQIKIFFGKKNLFVQKICLHLFEKNPGRVVNYLIWWRGTYMDTHTHLVPKNQGEPIFSYYEISIPFKFVEIQSFR